MAVYREAAPLLLARWLLNELAPEDIPALALDALKAGCEATSIAVLAGLTRPTRGEIEDELPALLQQLNLRRPTKQEAVKVAVDETARGITARTVAAYEGARHIWMSYADQNDPAVWDQLRVFVGLASQHEDDPERATRYDEEIIEAASELLGRGGLRLEGSSDG